MTLGITFAVNNDENKLNLTPTIKWCPCHFITVVWLLFWFVMQLFDWYASIWYVTLAKGSQPTGCGLLRGKRTSLNLWRPACEMLGLLACGHRSLLVCVLQIKPRASAELQFSDLSLFSLKRCSCLYRRTLAGVPYEISWVTPIVHADLSIPE